MKSVLLTCLIFTIVAYGHALKCPTCQGVACREEEVPLVECGFRHPHPLSAKTAMISSEASYQCLQFTYLKNGNIQEVKECIVTTPEKDVCQTLKEIYDVQTCKVRANLLKEKEENESENSNPPNDSNSSSSSSSSSSSTSTSTTTPKPTTTTPKSSTDTPKPTTTTPKSSTDTPKPTTTTPNSSTDTPKPTTTTPNSSTDTPKPTTTTPKTSPTTPKKNSGEISQISTVLAMAAIFWAFYF